VGDWSRWEELYFHAERLGDLGEVAGVAGDDRSLVAHGGLGWMVHDAACFEGSGPQVVEDGTWTPPVPLWACGTMRDGSLTLGCSRDRGFYGAVVWRLVRWIRLPPMVMVG
jgi:hypothetical protein